MAPPVTITFLGTASAVPSPTRNHSSLAITLPSGATWLFDCGEATQHQIQKVVGFRSSRIEKIFITHMHGDHVFGLAPLLCTLLNGAGGTDPSIPDPRVLSEGTQVVKPTKANIEIYGPLGLRQYLRSILATTYTRLGGYYVVHELHFPADAGSALISAAEGLSDRELEGKDILPSSDGYWRQNFVENAEWSVSAGPIRHSIPCLGYVLCEPSIPGKFTPEYRQRILSNKLPISTLGDLQRLPDGEGIALPDGTTLLKPFPRNGRKITVLGDTNDASGVAELARNSDVLIHEATNAFLGTEGETAEGVRMKTFEHGHSTPEMAAAFARSINLGGEGGVVAHVVGGDLERAMLAAKTYIKEGGEVQADKVEKSKGKKKEKEKVEEKKAKGVLLLNHFSTRYAAPTYSEEARSVMEQIRECAVKAWEGEANEEDVLGREVEVVCAYDLMQYEIRARD